MDTVIGLGEIGCNIADEFGKYKEYEVYKIGVGLEAIKRTEYGDFPQKNLYSLPRQEGPEEYEESCPSLKEFFKGVKGEVLFVVSASEDISAASLRILQSVRYYTDKISVLYIRPDLEFLPEKKRMNSKVVFNVLQEYTRSGVFERIYLIDYASLEEHFENIPAIGYYEYLDNMLVSAFHMINVYNHATPVMSTFSKPHDFARLSTIGVLDFKTGKRKMFFSLDEVKELRYYYAINKKKLESDGSLVKKIKDQVRDALDDEIQKASYGIYATKYDEEYVYLIGYSQEIQDENEK